MQDATTHLLVRQWHSVLEYALVMREQPMNILMLPYLCIYFAEGQIAEMSVTTTKYQDHSVPLLELSCRNKPASRNLACRPRYPTI